MLWLTSTIRELKVMRGLSPLTPLLPDIYNRSGFMELGKRISRALKKFILVALIITIPATAVASTADDNKRPLTLSEKFAAQGIKISQDYSENIYDEINYSDLKAQYEEKGYKPAEKDGDGIEIILDLKNI